jgi:predicted DNA-binding transcriptional regulator AlpA
MTTTVILHSRAVRERFGGVSDMTLWRWTRKGILPQPVRINGRNYWREADIVALQAGRAANDDKGGAQ